MASTPTAADAPPAPYAVDCRITAVENPARDIFIVRMARHDGSTFEHAAGQYARVAFDAQPERDYSIASRPSAPDFEFHIRNLHSGPSHHVATRMRVGDAARVRGPFGTTYLRDEHTGPILAIGGGSGLAPMKAIVEEALARGETQPIHLYFGTRDEPDLYLLDHFAALAEQHPNFRVVPVLSEPTGPTSYRTGLLPDAIAADFTDLSTAEAYLAGPPPMIEATVARLPSLGMPAHHIHADSFISEAERQRLASASPDSRSG